MGILLDRNTLSMGTQFSELAPDPVVVPQAPSKRESDSSLLGAAFRQNNGGVNLGVKLAESLFLDDSEDRLFNARAQARADGLDEDIDRFNQVKNKEQYFYLKAKIQQERQDKQKLEESNGFLSFAANVAAGLVDPVNLAMMALPGGQVRTGGVLVNAAKTSLAVAAETAAQEVILYGAQETRTAKDSMVNIGTSAVGGALIGGLLGKFAGSTMPEADRIRLGDALSDDIASFAPRQIEHASTSAAAVKGYTEIDNTVLKTSTPTKIIDGTTDLIRKGADKIGLEDVSLKGISARLAESDSENIRRMGMDLFDDGYIRQGTRSVSLESAVRHEQGVKMVNTYHIDKELHSSLDSLGELDVTQKNSLMTALKTMFPERTYTLDDLTPSVVQKNARELTTYKLNGGDLPIAQIENAAAKMKAIYDADLQRGLYRELFDEGDIVENYAPRVLNKRLIEARPQDFEATIRDGYLRELTAAGVENAETIAREIGFGVAARASGAVGPVDIQRELRAVMGDLAKQKGHAIPRTLDLPYEVLAPWLQNDFVSAMQSYNHSVPLQLALRERFNVSSIAELMEQMSDVAFFDRYAAEGMPDKLTVDAVRDARELAAAGLRRLTGEATSNSGFSKTARTASGYARLVMLPGQIWSNLVEVAAHVTHHTVQHSFTAAKAKALSSTVREISEENRRFYGAAMERGLYHMNAKMRAGFGEAAELGVWEEGGVLRRIGRAGEFMNHWAGMDHFDDFNRSMAVDTTTHRILRLMKGEFSDVVERDADMLGQLSIDESTFYRLKDMFTENPQLIVEENGLLMTRLSEWQNTALRDLFSQSLYKAQTTYVSTVGAGTLPTWADNDFAKLLIQFKSFVWAASSQVTYAGLQRGDASFYLGAAFSTAIGYAINEIKNLLNPSDTYASQTFGKKLVGAIDRSGFVAAVTEPVNWSILAGSVGLGTPNNPLSDSKRRESNLEELTPGASAVIGLGHAAVDVAQGLMNDDLERKDVERLFGKLPMQNYLGVRWGKLMADAVYGEGEYMTRVMDNAQLQTSAYVEAIKNATELSRAFDRVNEGFTSTYPEGTGSND